MLHILVNLRYEKTGHWTSGTKDYNNSVCITYVHKIYLEYCNSNILLCVLCMNSMPKCEAENYSVLTMTQLNNFKDHNSF